MTDVHLFFFYKGGWTVLEPIERFPLHVGSVDGAEARKGGENIQEGESSGGKLGEGVKFVFVEEAAPGFYSVMNAPQATVTSLPAAPPFLVILHNSRPCRGSHA